MGNLFDKTENKWSVMVEHVDVKTKTAWVQNIGMTYKQIMKVFKCDAFIGNGYQLEEDELLNILNLISKNYTVSGVYEISNHFNRDQKILNEIKHERELELKQKGYEIIDHAISACDEFEISVDLSMAEQVMNSRNYLSVINENIKKNSDFIDEQNEEIANNKDILRELNKKIKEQKKCLSEITENTEQAQKDYEEKCQKMNEEYEEKCEIYDSFCKNKDEYIKKTNDEYNNYVSMYNQAKDDYHVAANKLNKLNNEISKRNDEIMQLNSTLEYQKQKIAKNEQKIADEEACIITLQSKEAEYKSIYRQIINSVNEYTSEIE